jgi:hypothetical protein
VQDSKSISDHVLPVLRNKEIEKKEGRGVLLTAELAAAGLHAAHVFKSPAKIFSGRAV